MEVYWTSRPLSFHPHVSNIMEFISMYPTFHATELWRSLNTGGSPDTATGFNLDMKILESMSPCFALRWYGSAPTSHVPFYG